MSTTELAREFSINQKSSWLFKRKTQEVMKTGDNHPSYLDSGLVDLLIGGRKGQGGRKVRKCRLKPVIDWEIELENMGIFPFSGKEKEAGEQEFEISPGPPRREKSFRNECGGDEFERMAERHSSSLFRKVCEWLSG